MLDLYGKHSFPENDYISTFDIESLQWIYGSQNAKMPTKILNKCEQILET
jgi:hypothetical protein